VEGSNSFRGGVWIAIAIVVLAIGGLFLARYFHDNAAATRGASLAAPTTAFGGPRLASNHG
jgi:hypothetical protein